MQGHSRDRVTQHRMPFITLCYTHCYGRPAELMYKSALHKLMQTAESRLQAMWVQFAPSATVAQPESWQMYKLGQPVSPLDVVYNGSHSLHVVSDEGISVRGVGDGSWEQLNIR